ncbi:MAG TPA: ATP synthase subunit I [Pyrinomonadaceae bacterium]|jgi:diacylglycerol kinase|nr:ATP synthase subunit I [Pyrinomonadaceae bacterium]
MSEGADSARPSGASDAGEDPRAVERRVFRDTCIAVVVAVAASAMLAPWRVTTGLLLGGALSLFNMYWLRTSVSAVFDAAPEGRSPRMKAARYVLRYVFVVAAVAAANALGLVSLVATLAGMCLVVAALLAEGLRQLYFAIVRREET